MQQLLPEARVAEKKNGTSIYNVVNEWVEEIGPNAFVPVFLPFLMASNVHPNAKSVLVGMNVSHTRKHIARSIYEGICFGHRYHLEKLLATRDEAPKAIRLSGGAARSKVWTQMFADICQIPVETVAADEAGALGCAIAAAVAAGEYEDLNAAIAGMTQIHEAVLPNRELKEIYDKKYQLYLKTIECLDGLWDQMQALAEEQ